MTNTWFVVNKEGLAKRVKAKGKPRILWELAQNGWDEDGVTRLDIRLVDAPADRGYSRLTVEDDAPEGFADLEHTYMMFADSKKVDDPTKRGRFNIGEKLFLSICKWAEVTSTTGGYRFNEDGTRTKLRKKRPSGSKVEAVVELTNAEREEALKQVATLISPPNIVTTVNGTTLPVRTPVRSFEVSLPTEIANDEGILTKTTRKTAVNLYDPMRGETPHIYEMGIPVVEIEGRWHVDISQKVPLNMERDNVTPRYLRELRVAVLNHTADLLTVQDATSTWVNDAAGNDKADPEAIRQIVKTKFGDKVVRQDPSNPEANLEAAAQGYEVIPGNAFSREQWTQIKRAEVALPAGQVTPPPRIDTSPDGEPPIPQEKWTPAMAQVADYAKALAKELLGIDINVDIANSSQGAFAWYGGRNLTLNKRRLGNNFFENRSQLEVDELLLHEFSHERVSNHLLREFADETCRLGALLRTSTTNLSAYTNQKVGH